MEGRDTISVVIPARNAERTLRSTIRSVMRQDAPVADIVVVDDSSTDGTAGIALRYCDRIRFVRAVSHIGHDAARRLGFEHCSGSVVTFVDADDYIAHNALRKALAVMDETTDVVTMAVERFISLCPKVTVDRYVPDGSKIFEGALFDASLCQPSVWGKLYRRKVLEPWPETGYRGIWGEDRLMLMHLFCRHLNVKVCPEAVYRYRLGGSGSNARKKGRDKEFRQVARLKHEFVDRHPELSFAHHLIDKELDGLLAYRDRALRPGFAARLKNFLINYR